MMHTTNYELRFQMKDSIYPYRNDQCQDKIP